MNFFVSQKPGIPIQLAVPEKIKKITAACYIQPYVESAISSSQSQ